MKSFLLTLLTIVTLQCDAQKKELVTTLKAYAHPLTTTAPLEPMDDLNFLKGLTKDRPVIGLGEATHGTKEFFTMKHRLLRYFVEKMGYRHFAMEANFAECRIINDYVLYGKGDPETALRGIYFWTWNTMEVLDMVKWMSAYNADKAEGDKVQFWGFDMQYTLGAAKAILDDFNRLNISYDKYAVVLDSLSKNKRYYHTSDSTARVNIDATIADLKNYAENYKTTFIDKSSEEEYQMHCQYINTILQALGLYMNTVDRDSCMAQNIKWITTHTGTDKIVLWAHNGHIMKATLVDGAEQMGSWLNKIYGDEYYAIGFDFNTGNFNSKEAKYVDENKHYELKEFTISKTLRHSSDYTFRKLKTPIFFLDYKTASKNSAVNKFLSTGLKTKVIGAIYWAKWTNSYYHYMKLKEAFDATVYIDKTTASVFIPSYTQYVDSCKKIE